MDINWYWVFIDIVLDFRSLFGFGEVVGGVKKIFIDIRSASADKLFVDIGLVFRYLI
jgi:hypothetical protein